MQTLIFEDALCALLGPLADARPACSLSIGSATLLERLLPFGQLLTSLRPQLRRHLEQLAGERAPLWGGPAFAADGISVPAAAARPADVARRWDIPAGSGSTYTVQLQNVSTAGTYVFRAVPVSAP